MSTSLSSVRLPAVTSVWPHARRLLALAFVAALGAALTTATAAPHALAAGAVHVLQWMAGLSQLEVFLAIAGLCVVVVGISIATAIDLHENRELFDVR